MRATSGPRIVAGQVQLVRSRRCYLGQPIGIARTSDGAGEAVGWALWRSQSTTQPCLPGRGRGTSAWCARPLRTRFFARAKLGRVHDAHPPLPPPARLQGVIAGVAAAGALVASVLGARHLTQRATLRRQDGSDGVRLEVAHFADVTTMVDTEASVASLRAVCRTWEQALDHATCTSHPQPLRFGRGTALRSTPTVAFAAAEVYTLLLTTIPLERLVSAE